MIHQTKKRAPFSISLSKKNRRGFLLLLFGLVIYNLIPRFLYKYPDSSLKRYEYKLLNVNSISTYSSINNKASQREKDTPYSNHTSPWKQTWKERKQRPMIKKENMRVNLNAADSMALEMLPGIGPILSARIIKYRNKLGGFYAVAQLKEVYGISDSTFEKISPKIEIVKDSLKKIAVNLADQKTLAMHPYIGWSNAKLIIRYRQAHGTYKNIEQLESIWAIERNKLERLLPYLSFDSTVTSK